MTPESVIDIGRQMIWITVLLAAPMLVSALLVGLLIGIFQAATQINESTLSFIPKLAVLAGTLFVSGGWMLNLLVDYTRRLMTQIPDLIG